MFRLVRMKAVMRWWAAVAVLVLHVLSTTNSTRDSGLYCSVCRGLVEEIRARISQADPSQTVRVGSYRMDARGNQNLVEVKYATSNMHLAEILEDVCESFDSYAVMRDDVTDPEKLVRTTSRTAGKALDTSKVVRSGAQLQRTLKTYCEDLVEETENEIMKVFKQDDLEAVESQLCGEISGACTDAELAEPAPQLEEKPSAPQVSSIHVTAPDGSTLPLGGADTLQDVRNKILEAARASSSSSNDDEDCEEEEEEDNPKDEL